MKIFLVYTILCTIMGLVQLQNIELSIINSDSSEVPSNKTGSMHFSASADFTDHYIFRLPFSGYEANFYWLQNVTYDIYVTNNHCNVFKYAFLDSRMCIQNCSGFLSEMLHHFISKTKYYVTDTKHRRKFIFQLHL